MLRRSLRWLSSARRRTATVPDRSWSSAPDEAPLSAPLAFPSFSTSGKFGDDFVHRPSVKVAAEMTAWGRTHHLEFAPAYNKDTGQSGLEVHEGCQFAVEQVTGVLSQFDPAQEDEVLKGCLTHACWRSLTSLFRSDERFRNPTNLSLIDLPQSDILLSWTHHLRASDEGYEAMLCVISFPGYHRLKEQLESNKEKRIQFRNALMEREKMQAQKSARADLLREIQEFEKSLPPVVQDFNFKPLVVSNFHFVRGLGSQDPWLIDEIKMMNAADVFTRLGYFRWKGRMNLSFRGLGLKNAIRFDYYTDFLAVSLLTFYFISLFTR